MSNNKNQEFETKVLSIDVVAIIAQLRKLNAEETPEFLSRRYVFHIDIGSEVVEWIRLRQQGNGKTTITYKNKVKKNVEIGKTVEIEVEVSDFDKSAEILHKLHFKNVFYQENKNHIFRLNGIEFSIDTWPMLPAYLEVESDSVEKVQEGLRLLGLEGKDAGDKDVKLIYDDLGIDLHSYKELKFE